MKITAKLYGILCIFSAWLVPVLPCSGQATFSFYNYNRFYGIDAPVFDAAGVRLFGTEYAAILYGGPAPDALTKALSEGGGSQAPLPFTFVNSSGQNGYFRYSGYLIVPTVGEGGWAWLQVRAWNTRLGATYEEVAALGVGGYGASTIFQEQGGTIGGGVPSPPGVLYHLQSFSLLPVPEPSAVLLLGLGILGTWLWCKPSKKQ